VTHLEKLRDKYKYIVLWGKYLRSYDYYIDMQVGLAEEDNAPRNAIFKDHDGQWHTFDMVVNPIALHWFKANGVEKGAK